MDVPQGVRMIPRYTIEVCQGMSIQAAINTAAAQIPAPSATNPWTILIHPGTYTEQITCASYVNLKGIGPSESVIIQQVDADVITLANNVELEWFVVRVTTPTLARTLIKDNGVACIAKIKVVTLEITTPAALAHRLFNFTAASAIAIIGCFWNIGGTGITIAINNETAAATILLLSNDGTLAINAFQIGSTIAGTWRGGNNRFAGTCGLFNVTLGDIILDNDAKVCTGANSRTGGTVFFNTQSGATITVAASNSLSIDAANLICDGVDDHVEINTAIGTGRRVVLLDGTFTINGPITKAVDNVTLEGQGIGKTIITLANASNCNVITVGGNGWAIKNLTIDGNKANQGNWFHGIFADNKDDGFIDNVRATNCGHAIGGENVCLAACERWNISTLVVDNSLRSGLRIQTSSKEINIGSVYANNNASNGILIVGSCEKVNISTVIAKDNGAGGGGDGLLIDDGCIGVTIDNFIGINNGYCHIVIGESGACYGITISNVFTTGTATLGSGMRIKNSYYCQIGHWVSYQDQDVGHAITCGSLFIMGGGYHTIGDLISYNPQGPGLILEAGVANPSHITINNIVARDCGTSDNIGSIFAIQLMAAQDILINNLDVQETRAGAARHTTTAVYMNGVDRVEIGHVNLGPTIGATVEIVNGDEVKILGGIIRSCDSAGAVVCEDGDDLILNGIRFPGDLTFYIDNAATVRPMITNCNWKGCNNNPAYAAITTPKFTNNIDKDGNPWLVDDSEVIKAVWVKHDVANPAICIVPAGSWVSVELFVSELFNAATTNLLTIGYDADPDSVATFADPAIHTTGRKTPTYGVEGGYMPTSRAIEAYYTFTGGAPATGEALIIFKVTRAAVR